MPFFSRIRDALFAMFIEPLAAKNSFKVGRSVGKDTAVQKLVLSLKTDLAVEVAILKCFNWHQFTRRFTF